MALLSLLAPWCARAGRPLIAFVVDHRLHPDSAAWSRFAADAAAAAGARAVVLSWDGPKPATGLPAAARQARHRLIAAAGREAGVSIIALAHTADDVLESEHMRGEGTPIGRLKEWSPSPVWPEGRGVFLLRPLLSASREALRERLKALGGRWLDDPANVDPRYARVRARRSLESSGSSGDLPHFLAGTPGFLPESLPRSDGFGALQGALRTWPIAALGAALACVSGCETPVRGERLRRLAARLASSGPVAVTLGGCRVSGDGHLVDIVREPGEYARGGAPELRLGAGDVGVWDGRFLVQAAGTPVTIRPLQGLQRCLSPEAKGGLAKLPPRWRPTLPAVVLDDGRVTCPLLEPGPVAARNLVGDRLLAALGGVPDEAALRRARARMACLPDGPYLAP